MDPYALPCHPDLRLTPEDRDWRAIGVRSLDDVTRKQTRCPQCKTQYTAYQRRFGSTAGEGPAGGGGVTGEVTGEVTVEWVRPTPFLVTAAPVERGPVWQDTSHDDGTAATVPWDRHAALADLQAATAHLGPAWDRSVQLCSPVQVLSAGGEVFAEPGDLLLERREKWNAQDRRLALLWSGRLGRPVVAWHGFARLLQD